jgi:glycine cleavage system regulatory protein
MGGCISMHADQRLTSRGQLRLVQSRCILLCETVAQMNHSSDQVAQISLRYENATLLPATIETYQPRGSIKLDFDDTVRYDRII